MQRIVSRLMLGLVLVCSLSAPAGFAQAPPAAGGTAGGAGSSGPDCHTRTAGADARSAGDNAWMLVCAALVLMMTGPGLALFYGGLGAQEECAGHHDAELHSHGGGHCPVGILRLQPGLP